MVGSGSVWGATTTYTFTSKSWAANPASWTSGKDGLAFLNEAIQVSTGATGAYGTSPVSFSNVVQVDVNYFTNASNGVGTISVFSVGSTSTAFNGGSQIGSTFNVTKPASGGGTLKTATFNASSSVSGHVRIQVTCTTNSVFIQSVTITTVTEPTLATSVSSLTGFTYQYENGPSAIQSFTVSGSNLGANPVSVAPQAGSNYEISETGGAGFSAVSSISITPTSGSVTNKAIYVRLKAGLAVGAYNDDEINIACTGADSKTVTCSGSVTACTNPYLAFPTTLPTEKTDKDPAFSAIATSDNTDGTITYGSSDHEVATVNPSSGLITIEGTGSVTITATLTASNGYCSATDEYPFIVTSNTKTDQTISFTLASPVTYGDNDNEITLAGTATSSLAVAYESSDEEVATVSGNTLTILKAGSVIVTAKQEGDDTFNPAEIVEQTLVINKKALTIANSSVTTRSYNNSTAATITGILTGVVGSDDVGFEGTGTFADVNAGEDKEVTAACTLTGEDAGNYTLTQPTGLTGIITKATQTIAFDPIPAKFVGTADFNLTATATSGLSVTYTSSNPVVATVSPVGLVEVLAKGSTIITASQTGNNNYYAATDVQQTLTVTVAPTGIVIWNPAGLSSYGPSPWAPTTKNENLTVTGLTRGSGIGTGGTAATSAWGGAMTAQSTASSAVTANQFITFELTPNNGYTTSLSTLNLTYRRSDTGPKQGLLQYAINNEAYSDVSSLTFAAGNSGASISPIDLSSITSLQDVSNTSTIRFRLVLYDNTGGTWYVYNSGLVISGYVEATCTDAGLTFATATESKNFGDAAFTKAATVSTASAGAITYESSDENVATVDETTGEVTILSAGITTITATIAADGNYCAAEATYELTVLALKPTIIATGSNPEGVSAEVSATVSSDGGAAITEYGVYWSTDDGFADGGGTKVTATGLSNGSFTVTISGLTEETIYYYKVYATNSAGTGYSTQGTFTTTTGIILADLSTPTVSAVTTTSATLSGGVTLSEGEIPSDYGFYYSTTDGFADGTGTEVLSNNLALGVFSADLSGLIPNTVYYIKSFAIHSGGKSYSAQATFTTLAPSVLGVPVAIAATNITTSSFTANWKVAANADGYELYVYKRTGIAAVTETEGFSGIVPNEDGDKIATATYLTGWSANSQGPNRQIYTTNGNFGASSPSFAFTATNDYIETRTYLSPISTFSFWAKQQGGLTSTTSVEVYNGTNWQTITTFLNSDILGTDVGTTMTYDIIDTYGLTNIVKARLVYTKVSGNLSIDDIEVTTTNTLNTQIAGSPFPVFGGATTSYNVTGLDPNTEYVYEVKAKRSTETSAVSNQIPVKTLDTPKYYQLAAGRTGSFSDNIWQVNNDGGSIWEPALVAIAVNNDGVQKITIPAGEATVPTGTYKTKALEIGTQGKLDVSAGTLAVTDDIVMHLNDAGTAQLKAATGKLSANTLKVTKLFLKDEWYMISLPFAATQIQNAQGIAVSINPTEEDAIGVWAQTYDGAARASGEYNGSTSNNFVAISSGTTLEANKGYLFGQDFGATTSGSEILTFVSASPAPESAWTIATKPYDVTPHPTSMVTNPEGLHRGWNLIGVPFTSGYDLKTHLPGYITYVYDAASNDYIENTEKIEPFKAYFVQVSDDVAASISFHENGVGAFKGLTLPTYDEIELSLTADNSFYDYFDVRIGGEGATTGYDFNMDAHKILSATAPQLYSKYNGVDYAINAVPSTVTSIPLSYKVPRAGTYTINYNAGISDGNITGLLLIDKGNGNTVTDLLNTPSYQFTVAAGALNNASRFELQFELLGDIHTATPIATTGSKVKVIALDKQLLLQGLVTPSIVTLYDITGKKINAYTHVDNNQYLPVNLTGVYMVKVENAMQATTAKVILK